MEKFRKTRSVHIRYIYEFGTHTSKSIRYLVFYIVRMEKIRVQLILFHAAFTLDPSKILRLEPVCPLGHSTDHPCTRKSFESKSNAKYGMKGPVGTWYRPLHINQQVRNTQSLQAEANIGCPRIFSFVFSPVWLFTIRPYEYKEKIQKAVNAPLSSNTVQFQMFTHVQMCEFSNFRKIGYVIFPKIS